MGALSPRSRPLTLMTNLFFNWSVADLQCCVSDVQQGGSVMCVDAC